MPIVFESPVARKLYMANWNILRVWLEIVSTGATKCFFCCTALVVNVSTVLPEPNGERYVDDTLECIYLDENAVFRTEFQWHVFQLTTLMGWGLLKFRSLISP